MGPPSLVFPKDTYSETGLVWPQFGADNMQGLLHVLTEGPNIHKMNRVVLK